jgi:4'-phosphopantetheinyl transferase superfamily
MYVGVDVVSVNEVSRRASPRSAFAACFAAKEATLKALRPDTTAIDWQSIEIRRHASGWCDVVLHGEAAATVQDRPPRQYAQGAGSGADAGHGGCGVGRDYEDPDGSLLFVSHSQQRRIREDPRPVTR